MFIEVSLDQSSVYVQAQAILTLRIYHSVSLYDDSSLTPLQIADARIEQLGDMRTYEKDINGVRHGVIEMRYAIYPQHSGLLLIAPQTFSATLVDTQPSQDATAQGPKPGKLLRVNSAEIALTVKPKPLTYPADAPWLPARSLSLSESWNPEPEHIQVGDSLTRSLTLKVEGLASSQLPALPGTEANGLRRYPDQPVLSNQSGERGLIGSREEREALVPSRSGSIELPTVDVVWWNTFEDHLEHTSLPARTLQVANNPSLQVDTPAGTLQSAIVDSDTVWWWKLSTLILACTTLLGFGLWWRARWQPAVHRAAQTGPSPRTLLDDIKRACQANDPQATRQALDAWARQQPETLADMAARFVPLSDALDGLNGALYSETGSIGKVRICGGRSARFRRRSGCRIRWVTADCRRFIRSNPPQEVMKPCGEGIYPDGLQSSPELYKSSLPDTPHSLILRLLRSRWGRCDVSLNPLATETFT